MRTLSTTLALSVFINISTAQELFIERGERPNLWRLFTQAPLTQNVAISISNPGNPLSFTSDYGETAMIIRKGSRLDTFVTPNPNQRAQPLKQFWRLREASATSPLEQINDFGDAPEDLIGRAIPFDEDFSTLSFTSASKGFVSTNREREDGSTYHAHFGVDYEYRDLGAGMASLTVNAKYQSPLNSMEGVSLAYISSLIRFDAVDQFEELRTEFSPNSVELCQLKINSFTNPQEISGPLPSPIKGGITMTVTGETSSGETATQTYRFPDNTQADIPSPTRAGVRLRTSFSTIFAGPNIFVLRFSESPDEQTFDLYLSLDPENPTQGNADVVTSSDLEASDLVESGITAFLEDGS